MNGQAIAETAVTSLPVCLSFPPTFVCFVTFVVNTRSGVVRKQDLFLRSAP